MGELVSGCPRCAALTDAARNAEAANAILLADRDKLTGELYERIDALTASLATAHKQIGGYKAKLSQLHKEDPKAETILACLAVWEECCWAGKRRPSLGLDDKRAALVRRALKMPRIGEQDICDAFRGLGLLPYVGERGRTGSPAAGVRRFAEVEHALRDAPTLERFRDYYRRVRASGAERRLELLHQAWLVERTLGDTFAAELRRARHERGAVWAEGRAQEIPAYVTSAVSRVLRAQLGERISGSAADVLALAAVMAVDGAEFEHERSLFEERRGVREAPLRAANARGHLFVIDGEKKEAA